jgi:NitT/TauT family transport system permease protein
VTEAKTELSRTAVDEPDVGPIEHTPTRRQFRVPTLLYTVGAIAVFLVAWETVVARGWANDRSFSQPSEVFAQAWAWLSTGEIYPDLLITGQEVVYGLVIGAILAIAVATLFQFVRPLDRLLSPAISVANAVPRIVLAPYLLIALGIGLLAKVTLVAIMVFFIVFYAVKAGLESVEDRYLHNVRILGARRREVFFGVYLPTAIVWLVTSLRAATGWALMGAVVAEYVGSNAGIGNRIATAQATSSVTRVFAGVLIIVAMGGLLNWALSVFERPFVRWRQG